MVDSDEYEVEEEAPEVEAAEGEGDKKEPLFFSAEDDNICFKLYKRDDGKRLAEKIVDKVIGEFDEDWEGAEKYRELWWRDWRQFAGEMSPKSFPFEGCANVNLPMASENFLRLLTRMMTEVFGGFDQVAVYQSTGLEDAVAQPLTQHTNWQLRRQVRSFPAEMERACLLYLIPGEAVCHSFYDTFARSIRHETLTCDEFVMPYAAKCLEPDLSDLPHYTRILYLYPHQIRQHRGDWCNLDEVLDREATADDEPVSAGRVAAEAAQGVERPASSDHVNAPYKVLQYEGWDDGLLEEYGQHELSESQDKRDRWIQAIVDYESRTLMKLTIHEVEDWRDKARFDQQQMELTQYEDAREMSAQAAQVAPPQLGDTPVPPPPWATMTEDGEVLPPVPPRMVPQRLFTRGVCIQSLGSAMGLGFGRIQTELNRAANTAYNQMVDQATMNNAGGWLASKNWKTSDTVAIEPGKITPTTMTAQELKDGLREFKPGPPNPMLSDVALKLYEFSQSSASAPDVLSGASGKSGETWRGQASRVEQAVKQLSYFGRKFAQFVEHILERHAYLNSVFLPESEFVSWSAGSRVEIRREWYRLGYTVSVRADLSFTPRVQRIAEADEILQMVLKVPHLMANNAIVYAALVDDFEARGKPDMVKLLGAPPPAPPQFQGPPPPMPEGAGPAAGPAGQQGAA